MLYRLFPFDPRAAPGDPGGPLFVPRSEQGRGRHDAPDAYGALYLSRTEQSAVAEYLWPFRGQTLTPADLTRGGVPSHAIMRFEDAALGPLTDLDDPNELVRRALRPSVVATRQREVTQAYALRLFQEGLPGFEWWSTIDASWKNVTLFAERAAARLRTTGRPEPLGVDHPSVVEAAEVVGVTLAA